MKATGFTIVALLLTATAAQAQYSGGRGMGDRDGRGQHTAPPGPPSRSDVERRDPILVLMTNRSKLVLTESEVGRLETLDATVMEENRPLLAQYDSVLALMPTSTQGSGGDAAEDAGPRTQLFQILRDVRKNYGDAERSALQLLTSDQRAKATKLLKDERPNDRDLMPGGDAEHDES